MDVGEDSGSHTEAKLQPNCDSSRGLLIMTIRPTGGPQKPVKSQRGHAAQKTVTAQRTLPLLGGCQQSKKRTQRSTTQTAQAPPWLLEICHQRPMTGPRQASSGSGPMDGVSAETDE